MNRKIVYYTVIALLLFAAAAQANPTPGPQGINFITVMQTLEFTFHIEKPIMPDSMGTLILYGGPTLVRIWSPSEIEGNGLGIELGCELRKYFKRPMSGPFSGVYLGLGALWRQDEEDVRAISGGIKLGWRIPLISKGVSLDLEPYVCFGVKLYGTDEEYGNDFFATTLYLGTKFDFF